MTENEPPYRYGEVNMSLTGVLAAKKAAELRIRAEDAKRRAATSDNEGQKAMHLRRQKEFEKLAVDAETVSE